MSLIQVRDTVEALLKDATLGLAKTIQTLSGAASAPTLRFVAWKNAGTLQPGASANIVVQPMTWQPELKRQANVRESVVQLQVSYESFQSDAHRGTVVDVIDPLAYTFGQFVGGTSAGFHVLISIEEQATQ